jgi:hypothetical protein
MGRLTHRELRELEEKHILERAEDEAAKRKL